MPKVILSCSPVQPSNGLNPEATQEKKVKIKDDQGVEYACDILAKEQ